jgi:hypothetical protein
MCTFGFFFLRCSVRGDRAGAQFRSQTQFPKRALLVTSLVAPVVREKMDDVVSVFAFPCLLTSCTLAKISLLFVFGFQRRCIYVCFVEVEGNGVSVVSFQDRGKRNTCLHV